MNSVVVLLFYALAGILLHESKGFYDRTIVVYTLGFFTCMGAMGVGGRANVSSRACRWLAGVTHAVFCALVFNGLLITPPASAALDRLVWATSVAWALSLVLCVLLIPTVPSRCVRDAFRVTAALTLLLLAAEHLLVPLASPHPTIDVWVNNTSATRYFLKGINPYSVTYPDVYNGKFGYVPGFLYFPGSLFFYAPVRLLGGDIRFAHVVAIAAAAAGFFALARRHRQSEPLCWLLPMLWMSLPVTLFVLDQAWLDALLVPFLVWAAWALSRRDWLWAGLLFGVAIAVKQYAVIALGPALVLGFRQGGWPASRRLIGIAAASLAMLTLPLALHDWTAFYQSTIGGHLDTPMRPDAYNATMFFFHECHWLLPETARVALSALGGLAALAWIACKPVPLVKDWVGATCLAYGVTMLFGKWAFVNYYYLLASFVLIFLACSPSAPRGDVT